MRKKTAPFQYLLECSQMSLEDFELDRLDRAANLRRQLRDIAEEWIDAEVEARLSRWVRENRRHSDEHALNSRRTDSAPNSNRALLPASGEADATEDLSTKSVHLRLGRPKGSSVARVLPPPAQISTHLRASRAAARLAVVANLCAQRNWCIEQVHTQADKGELGPNISREPRHRCRGPRSR